MTFTLADHEQAFRRDPSDTASFQALRRSYEASAAYAPLAGLHESHAASVGDPRRAADLLWRAAEYYRRLADAPGERRALQKANLFDPENLAVLDRLLEIVRQRDDLSEAVRILEQKVALSARQPNRRQTAELHQTLGDLWQQRLLRLDKALEHYREAFRLAPDLVSAIEAGRGIYAKLGRWQTVVNLYEVQLTTVREPAKRATLLAEVARLQREQLGDLESAARSLSQALASTPTDEALMEAMGEIYASPAWPTPGGLDRAAATFMQIAQRREARGDREGAITYLRRALGADPESDSAANRLERICRETNRWDDLDQLLQQRIAVVSRSEAARLAFQRAELLEQKLGDIEGAQRCYEDLLAGEPLGGPAETRLREIYQHGGNHKKMLALHQRTLGGNPDQATRVRAMVDMAILQLDKLGAPEAAAQLLHEVLQLDPVNRRAITGYERYFRQRGDLRRLAELVRFSIDSMRSQGASPSDLAPRIEMLAELCENEIGDLPAALEAWNNLAAISPRSLKARERATGVEDKIANAQERARELKSYVMDASTPHEARRRRVQMARAYCEELIDPLAAADILREVLGEDPQHEEAQGLLTTIYEREANDGGLAESLRMQLDGILTREERCGILLRLCQIYERQQRDHDALWAYRQLADLAAHPAELPDRFLEFLAQSEDYSTLLGLLERRAASGEQSDRLEALKRIGRLYQQSLDQPSSALDAWLRAQALAPQDSEVFDALMSLYRQLQNHDERIALISARLDHGEPAKAERIRLWRELAQLAESAPNTVEIAVRAHNELCRLLPADHVSLDALARLYQRHGSVRELCMVLDRQLALSTDPPQRVELAMRRAALMSKDLSDHAGAIGALEEVLASVAPGNLDVIHQLKALHETHGDPRRYCELAELEAYLASPTAAPADKVDMAIAIADFWHERLADPHGTVVAYERVLAVDERNTHSLSRLHGLYRKIDASAKLVQIAPIYFAVLEDSAQRMALVKEVALVWEQQLADPRQAFEWQRRCHELFGSGSGALDELRRLSAHYELWDDILPVLIETRNACTQPSERLSLSRELAAIAKAHLGDPARAFELLSDGLASLAADAQVLEELEALAHQGHIYELLLAAYQELVRDAKPLRGAALEGKCAALAEHQMGNPAQALIHAKRQWELLLAANAELPSLAAQVAEVERLAPLCAGWQHVRDMHLERMRLADSTEARVAVLLHLAELFDGPAKAPALAFDALLYALLIAPDDQAVLARLWPLAKRLAGGPPPAGEDLLGHLELSALRAVLGGTSPLTAPGRSAEVGVLPRATPPKTPAPPSRRGEGALDAAELFNIAPTRPRRDEATIEITGSDLIQLVATQKTSGSPFELSGAQVLEMAHTRAASAEGVPSQTANLRPLNIVASGPGRDDRTMELTISDLADARPTLRDTTVELSAADVIEVVALDETDYAHDPGVRPRRGTLKIRTSANTAIEVDERQTVRVIAPPVMPQPARSLAHLPRQGGAWERVDKTWRMIYSNQPLNLRADRLFDLAETWATQANDVQRAMAVLVECVTLAPQQGRARQRLEELAAKHGRHDALLEAYREILEHVQDASLLFELHLRCADLQHERGALDGFEHHLQAALALAPSSERPFEALRTHYRQLERWEQLAALLQKWAGQHPPEHAEVRHQILAELADVYEHKLHRHDDAAAVLASQLESGDAQTEEVERLAQLYASLGQWARHVETLQTLLARATTPEEHASRWMALGTVFDSELELPHRAIEAFEQAASETPSATAPLQALERLYSTHERHADLQKVLVRLAALTEDPAEEKTFRLRLAENLTKQDDHAGAAEELARARTLSPDDPAVDAALGKALIAAGRLEDAHALYEQRAALAQQAHDDVATARSLLELARLQSDQLSQPAAAVESLRRALELDPGLAEALRELALLYARLEQWEAFVATTLRRCGLVTDTDTVGDYLMASAALLTQHGQHPLAAGLYAKVLERYPQHLGALNALLGLTTDPERRLRLLARKAALVHEPGEQAMLLVEQAKAQAKLSDDAAAALALLRKAHQLAPDRLEVLDALSEHLVTQRELPAARKLLLAATEALAPQDARGPKAAALFFRLGLVCEQLGQPEDGYRYLTEAIRAQPADLLARLALGKNRYRAGRWPEALRHLRETAAHPEAPTFRPLVADALYHAGLCERRLRRPERALPFFEQAHTFDPNHRETLSELATHAERIGERLQAASRLEQLGTLDGAPAARCEHLHRGAALFLREGALDRAADCCETLFLTLSQDKPTPGAPPPAPGSRSEWLRSALEILIKAERHSVAAAVAQALSAVSDSNEIKCELLLSAAREHQAAGAWPDADAANRSVLELSPHSVEAALGLSLSLEAQGRPAAVIELLEPFLTALSRPRAADRKAIVARLYETLGCVHRELDHLDEAIEAFEARIDLTESEEVRHALAALYERQPRRAAAALANHRALAKEIENTRSLAALARASAEAEPHRAHCIYSVLEVLERNDDAGREFLARYSAPQLPLDAKYEGVITDRDRKALLSAEGAGGMRTVFAALWEAASLLVPRSVEELGVDTGFRISPLENSPLAKVAAAISRAIDAKQTSLYRGPRSPGDNPIEIVLAARPGLVIRPEVEELSVERLRFVIGRSLELTHPWSILAAGLPRGEFAQILAAVVRAFHPRHAGANEGNPQSAVAQRAERYRREFPYPVARKLGEFFRERPDVPFDSATWRHASQLSANRVALVLCGSVRAAADQIISEEPELQGVLLFPEGLTRSPALRDLLTFAASESYAAMRTKLGLA